MALFCFFQDLNQLPAEASADAVTCMYLKLFLSYGGLHALHCSDVPFHEMP